MKGEADAYAHNSLKRFEAACWAHVRRQLYDIHVANGSVIAAEAIERISSLYGIEREIPGKPSDISVQRNEPPR